MEDQVSDRLAKLALAIGKEAAEREFERMKQSQPSRLLDVLDRRIVGEPLPYILGHTPFGPLDLLARPPVLISRPETAHWVIRLAGTRTPSADKSFRVLDLCTGSGCIPLLLCHLWPSASTRAVGVDISPDAILLAADNTSRTQTSKGQNVFNPLLADILDPNLLDLLDPSAPFDIVTANPPYVPVHEFDSLPSSIKDYEDRTAIVGSGNDGLFFYRAIAAFLAREGVLAPRASIAFEFGDGQAQDVARILQETPGLRLDSVEIWKDHQDKDRVVVAHLA